MSEFEYKVSVIVPVYNVEPYLRDCLDSLLAQTIDHEQMEVLLINDGSTDNSLAICEEYAELFSMFKVFSQENAGVSAARNVGIKNANGKYLFFLDSDDMITRETIKETVEFFESVYDEVDLVTYKIIRSQNGKQSPMHFRYNFLQKSGIYDLDEFPYVCQTTMNILTKNLRNESILFETALSQAEDQNYILRNLLPKNKIGYVQKGLYTYVIRSDSAVGTSGYAFYLWESVISNYFEKFFLKCENGVPKYQQALFLYDSNWKIRKDQFFPYHYDKDKFDKSVKRLSNLLKLVDIDILLNFPALDYYHKFFLLKLRETPVSVISTKKSVQIVSNGKVLHNDKVFTVVVTQIKAYKNTLKVLAHIKSPLFAFIEKPILYANVNGEQTPVELFESTASRYKSKMKTGLFWGFYFETKLNCDLNINFTVEIDGFCYDTTFYFMEFTPFNLKLGFSEFTTNNGIVSVKNNILQFRIVDDEQRTIINKRNNEIVRRIDPVIYSYRLARDETSSRKIWLYYDCKGVAKDNGYYQFMHDIKMQDGIERYYILNNEDSVELFEDKSKVIIFGSNKHKFLFINADKIITAYIERNNIYPFSNDKMLLIMDILHYETVYLQHGILHASIPWKYTPEALQIDKIVVSSYFEAENFVKKYNFRKQDLYKCGMPRFDHIDKNLKPKNRVLFAPSWRNYLIMPQVDNFWQPETEKFVKSDYFVFFNKFLNNPRLEKVLKENNLYLDFKIHPIFTCYKELFDNINEHVSFAGSTVKDEEYAAFITDFSSFVFDFVYLKRPIMYFVPDIMQFKSGMSQYRELDLPLEKAFGNLVTDPESAVDELCRMISNNFVPDEIFKERMESFYLPMGNCSEDIYNCLMEE